jgi:hypothetical protein
MKSDYGTQTFNMLSVESDFTHTGSLLYMAHIVDHFTYNFVWQKEFYHLTLFEFTVG